jgi:hypothetical protein
MVCFAMIPIKLAITPTPAEDLWRRLASVLPKLLRTHVQARVDARDVAATPLPALVGPIDDADGRCYECSERLTQARIVLRNQVGERGTYQVVVGGIVSYLYRGMIVFQCRTYTDPSDELFVNCYPHVADEMIAILQSIDVS